MQDLKKKKKKRRVLLPSEGKESICGRGEQEIWSPVPNQVPELLQHLFVHIIEEDAGFLLKALKCSKYFLVIMQEDLKVGPVMGYEPVPFHSF